MATLHRLHLSRVGPWLVACALALRLLVAPGYMPMAGSGGFTLQICSQQAGLATHVPGKPDAPMPGNGDCPYAGLAAPATLDTPPLLAALPPALRRAVNAVPVAERPHLGVPAPPPPSTGPPHLA